MRIITLNLNGVRSAANKGFFQWLAMQNADIVCVQELKAQACDIAEEISSPDGYHGYFHCAEKKGYSGVGIYSRNKPDNIIEGVGIAGDRCRGSLSAHGFWQFKRDIALPSFRFQRRTSPGRQVLLYGAIFSLAQKTRRHAAGKLFCAVTGISPTRKSISGIGAPTRKIRAFSRRSGSGSAVSSTSSDLWTYSGGSTRSLSNIPGGPIGGRPGPRTWAGASIIRLPRPRSPAKANRRFRFTRRIAFLIIHRLLSTTTTAYEPDSERLAPPQPLRMPIRSNGRFRIMPSSLSVWLHAFRIYTHPRVLGMLSLGFSAGLPLLLVLGTLSFWLREAGIDRSTIGHLSWIGLAYGFKWMWSPLVDRLPLPLLTRWLGRRRAWLLLSQVVIAVCPGRHGQHRSRRESDAIRFFLR